eukprot:CAMPEP_0172367766 /NCGR_PEP_ID=MMETSP1060-20121228/23464_1 /TAXON_ID=37318 /ORGANISM="Pseudo-nitzschia pungens, Strain cf. cingulata" /LENGTH=236 /DNA_ID=CAMNT_0013092125 /DNA_START=55 /DNA_END=765 /DNA_ORIENTATION=+
MKTFSFLALAAPVAAFTSQNAPSRQSSTQVSETKADLEVLAGELNPVVKFWDPLNLADAGLYGMDAEDSIRFLREAEIKHGRVAMAAFVGHCVQSNVVFPWKLTAEGVSHPSTDLSPPAQWDALPIESKFQIIGFVGVLEWFWYVNKTDKVGEYPKFAGKLPHPVPFELFDPFGFSKNKSEEAKARGLKAEINNGRLAMIGIFGFVTAETVPGSVPTLTSIVKAYDGNYWAPFESL